MPYHVNTLFFDGSFLSERYEYLNNGDSKEEVH